MGIQTTRRPFPFADEEIRTTFKNVSGSTLSAGDVVVILTGKNPAATAEHDVPAGDFYTDLVTALTDTSTGGSVSVGGIGQNQIPFLGLVTETIEDDEVGEVLVRGAERVSCTLDSSTWVNRGSIVYLNGNANELGIHNEGGTEVVADGEVVVGKLLEPVKGSGAGTATAFIYFNGIDAYAYTT